MLKSFFWTPKYVLYAWLMLAWLLFIGWFNVQILVYYNAWNREFYDAIQTLQEERFWDLFWGFNVARFWDFITLNMDEKTMVPSFLEILIIYVPMVTYATWQHSFYRLFYDALWEFRHHLFWVGCALTTWVTSVPYVRFVCHLIASQNNLISI